MPSNRTARLASIGIGLGFKIALEPALTLPVLLAIIWAPPSVGSELSKNVSPEAVAKLTSVLKALIGVGVLKKLSALLSRKWLNNFTSDVYDWDKEIVVVTGGSGGIGASVVDHLAEKGVRVAIIDINPPIKTYPNVSYHKCDVTSSEDVYEAAAEIKRVHGGPVSVLVNNAGIGNARLILEHEEPLLRKTFEINVISHFTTCKAFLPDMIAANHGHVVEIASMAAYITVSGMAAYCATKAGVNSFTEGLRQELRHHYKAPKVRTSIVCPSWIRSAITGPWEDRLITAGEVIMKTEDAGKLITDHILKGESGHVIIPSRLSGTTNIRSLPWWLQEGSRDGTGNLLGIQWKGGIVP